MIRTLLRLVSRKARDEDGSATVEFAILFPAFIMVFMSAFESGIFMVRNVMLERGVDIAVRDLRLGLPVPPSFDEFKATVCDNAVIIDDCLNVVQIELQPVNTLTWAPLQGDAKCIDQASVIDPIDETTYLGGGNNEMMLVRVCALYQPFFPSTTLGMQMPKDDFGNYALVVTSAFVNEPSR